jgi:O-glycosyl hydrolase
MRNRQLKYRARGWTAFAAGLALLSASALADGPHEPAPRAAPAAATAIEIYPGTQYQTIQGWGTSLAWWAEGTGGWSSTSAKNALAAALFSPSTGLGLNVVRYALGAGTPDDTCAGQMRVGADIPSFEQSAGQYDWSQDPNQRWMLQAAKSLGANVFEATTYSAPAWMTLDDCSAGATTAGADNLGSSEYSAYAQYLATVVAYFRNSLGIPFSTVEPFNEPVQSSWSSAGEQQAMNLGTTARSTIISDLYADLASDGLGSSVGISASDELGPEGTVTDYDGYTAQEQADLAQFNTHDYRAGDGSALYALGQQTQTPVWMSEWGADASPTQMDAGVTLSQHILGDEQQMHPAAWVIWQGVDGPEDGGNIDDLWGLVWADISPSGTGALTFPKRYYVMGNYSKFVHPGARMISNSDSNTFTAYDPASQSLVIVATNPGTSSEQVSYDLSNFATTGSSASAYQTDATENLSQLSAAGISAGKLAVTLPAQSVTTYVVPSVTFSSTLASSPVAQYGSQVQIYGRNAAGVTSSSVYSSSTGWSSWNSIGGVLADNPTAIQYGQQMQVFGRTSGGTVYSDVYTPGSSWSGWQSIGGDLIDDPVAIQYGSQLQVFGLTTGGVATSDVYTPGSSWSGWHSIGGTLTGNLSVVVYGQQLQVYGRTSGGGVYSNIYNPASGWSGWQNLGGNLAGDLSAVQYGSQVELFGLAGSGATETDVMTPGRGWSGWQSLGGVLTGDVSAVQYGSQLEVYGRAASGTVWSDVYTPGSGWTGWTGIGGAIADTPVAIQYGSQLEVYGRGSSGATYSNVYTPTSGWSGWQNLGGNLVP